MSAIWDTKKWSLGPLGPFSVLGGYTTAGIGGGGLSLTRTIPFQKKQLGFDPRLLVGIHLKIDERVYRIKSISGEQLWLDDVIAIKKTQTQTQIQQARAKDCYEPNFAVVPAAVPIYSSNKGVLVGWDVAFGFDADVAWEVFSATIKAPGFAGVWTQESSAFRYAASGQSAVASFRVHCLSGLGHLGSFSFNCSATAGFPDEDEEGNDVCGGEHTASGSVAEFGNWAVDEITPHPNA